MTFHLSIRPRSRPLYNGDSRVVDGFRMDGIVSKDICIYIYTCVRILVILFTRGGSFLFFLEKILLFLISCCCSERDLYYLYYSCFFSSFFFGKIFLMIFI